MTIKTLRLAPTLAVPIDFATEGLGVVGMRGSGKTNIEVRWCEVLYKAKIPFVVIEPKGDWKGIQSSVDGKSPGLPVPVFGGLYGDFPLDETLGRRIADLLVDENMSAVIDVSRLSVGARARFLTDFFEQLMDRHQREPHVRCVILEEAHRYIPQKVPAELTRVKEAAAAILLEGRSWGLGCWAATQRPARLNKDVMEEVGTIFVFRLGVAATNDRRTVTGWFQDEDNVKEIASTFTKLGNGEGWVHAPSTLGITQRVQFDRRTTFDSAATPLVGASGRPIATMATIDSAAIKEALSDAIEKAKANDPKELKKELAKARADLAARPSVEDSKELSWWRQFSRVFAPDQLPEIGSAFTGLGPLYLAGAPVEPQRVDVPFVPVHVLDARDRLLDAMTSVTSTIGALSSSIDTAVTDAAQVAKLAPVAKRGEIPLVVKMASSKIAEVRQIPVAPTVDEDDDGDETDGGVLKAGARKMAEILFRYGQPLTRDQLSVLAAVTRGGTLSKYANALRAAGYTNERNGYVELTATGTVYAASMPEANSPIPSIDEIVAGKSKNLKAGARNMIAVLLEIYPSGMPREELAARAGVTLGGTLSKYANAIKIVGLVEEGGGEMRAAPVLYIGRQ